MPPKGKDGSQGPDNADGNDGGNPEHGAGDLGELKGLIAHLKDEVASLKGSLPTLVQKATFSHVKRLGLKPAKPASVDHDEPDDGDDDDREPQGDRGKPRDQQPNKPPRDPRVRELERKVEELTRTGAEQEQRAAAARRASELRSAIAKSGLTLNDNEAAFRILDPDFEPDEESGGLKARDVAFAGKSVDDVVKARLGAMKWLLAPSGRAGGDPSGEQKPGSGEFRKDPNATPEENLRAWRAHQAAKKTG